MFPSSLEPVLADQAPRQAASSHYDWVPVENNIDLVPSTDDDPYYSDNDDVHLPSPLLSPDCHHSQGPPGNCDFIWRRPTVVQRYPIFGEQPTFSSEVAQPTPPQPTVNQAFENNPLTQPSPSQQLVNMNQNEQPMDVEQEEGSPQQRLIEPCRQGLEHLNLQQQHVGVHQQAQQQQEEQIWRFAEQIYDCYYPAQENKHKNTTVAAVAGGGGGVLPRPPVARQLNFGSQQGGTSAAAAAGGAAGGGGGIGVASGWIDPNVALFQHQQQFGLQQHVWQQPQQLQQQPPPPPAAAPTVLSSPPISPHQSALIQQNRYLALQRRRASLQKDIFSMELEDYYRNKNSSGSAGSSSGGDGGGYANEVAKIERRHHIKNEVKLYLQNLQKYQLDYAGSSQQQYNSSFGGGGGGGGSSPDFPAARDGGGGFGFGTNAAAAAVPVAPATPEQIQLAAYNRQVALQRRGIKLNQQAEQFIAEVKRRAYQHIGASNAPKGKKTKK